MPGFVVYNLNQQWSRNSAQTQKRLSTESAQNQQKSVGTKSTESEVKRILGLRMIKREKTDDMEKASVEVTKQPCWVMTH